MANRSLVDVTRDILNVLELIGPMTVAELARRLDDSPQRIYHGIRMLRNPLVNGGIKPIHIGAWHYDASGASAASAIWVLGDDEDIPRPEKQRRIRNRKAKIVAEKPLDFDEFGQGCIVQTTVHRVRGMMREVLAHDGGDVTRTDIVDPFTPLIAQIFLDPPQGKAFTRSR